MYEASEDLMAVHLRILDQTVMDVPLQFLLRMYLAFNRKAPETNRDLASPPDILDDEGAPFGGGNMDTDNGTESVDGSQDMEISSSDVDPNDETNVSETETEEATGEAEVSPVGEYNTMSIVIYRWADEFSVK